MLKYSRALANKCLFLFIPGCILSLNSIAATTAYLAHSRQALVVTSANWNATRGELQRFSRADVEQPWHKLGNPIPVMLGKAGMGWGMPQASFLPHAPLKQEGDKRTPAGIFSLGTAFGFAPQPDFPLRLAYLPLTAQTVCVDDQKSRYYNQIVNSNQVTHIDWHSGEQMQQEVPYYTWGVMINFNSHPPVPGKGSCVFLHVWKPTDAGTSGCVATRENDLKEILTWLNPAALPRIVILPIPVTAKRLSTL